LRRPPVPLPELALVGSVGRRFRARQLLGKIDRDFVKPSTMTVPYGVTRGTIYEQLLETKVIQSCKDPEKCARYLAKILEESIPDVAVEASKIMKWLRTIARTLAKAGLGLAWTSPAGFPVVREIREPKEVRLSTADRRITIHKEDQKRKIDWRKQRRAPGSFSRCHAHDADSESPAQLRLATFCDGPR
jgi:DNA-directed RNA polymerase, mitochondrial